MSIVGNKAKNLQVLKNAGFLVPDFIVLPPDLEQKQDQLKKAVADFVSSDKLYAVRSSATLEDTANASFAGQYLTELNVAGAPEVVEAALRCYGSAKTAPVIAYLERNRLPANNLSMAVIVQEMVDPDISGVAFSVNPLSGMDTEIVIDVTEGLGDALVSGHITPEEYVYDWYDNRTVKLGSLLEPSLFMELVNTVLRVQRLFGYPVDVEFAIKNNAIYLLQSRAITKILSEGLDDEWTTADFKDGGVSATICTPFMWSLYEYVWQTSFRRYLTSSLFLEERELNTTEGPIKLGAMFFGRPYWNLSKTKLAMANVPGYREREFDEGLGIDPTYEGDGVTTGLNPKSVACGLRVLKTNASQIKRRLRNNREIHGTLSAQYQRYLKSIGAQESDWQKLVFEDYLLSEGAYFEQIFINTVAYSIYRTELLKHTTEPDFLKLLMGLEDISHLRPYRALWRLSRKDRLSELELAAFLDEFGHHSDKELDVTYPHYAETPTKIREQIAALSKIPDEYDPAFEAEQQKATFMETYNKLPRRLARKTLTLRSLLWWREELRDVSTKYYYVIRRYTLELAKDYHERGIIASVDDIWFLKIADIRAFMQGEITHTELQEIIDRNRCYYDSFVNYTPANEIGRTFSLPVRTGGPAHTDEPAGTNGLARANSLAGIGCSTGTVTGRARIVRGLSEIDSLEPGDILVTRFTDTGWTSKFALLSGIVTEYGGLLCHAAIVSREFGIPCVVCVKDALKLIEDGATITINGATGLIRIEQ